MPIQAKCGNCSKVYTVKDELAGKKFRCKECEAAVTVPDSATVSGSVSAPIPARTPKPIPQAAVNPSVRPSVKQTPKPKPKPEPEEDLFSSNDFDDFGDDFESDDDSDFIAPVRSAKGKKKPVVKKKKKSKKSTSGGRSIFASIGAIAGGVFGFLFVLGFVFRIINAMGGIDLGTSWVSYTTPDGHITVLLPGKATSVPARAMAPGGQSFGAGRRNFACAITIEPMVGELAGMTEEQLFQAFQLGSGFVGASNVQQTQINGRSAFSFESTAPGGVKSDNVAFMYQNKVYTLNHAYKGMKGSNGTKFFNSVKFN